MTQRFNVVRISDDMVVNTILLDGPEPDGDEFRYVPAGDIGIGWTSPIDGEAVPPAEVASPPAAEDLNSLLVELEELRSRIAAATGGA